MIHINSENFSNFVETLTTYTLRSINNLNEYFDADEVYTILKLIANGTNEKSSRDGIKIIVTTVRKYLNMDGIVADDDIDIPFILNICTQYIKGEIQ